MPTLEDPSIIGIHFQYASAEGGVSRKDGESMRQRITDACESEFKTQPLITRVLVKNGEIPSTVAAMVAEEGVADPVPKAQKWPTYDPNSTPSSPPSPTATHS